MPALSALHDAAVSQFSAAFGEPQRVFEKDAHWPLRAASGGGTINVLLNGSPDFPVIWVFDPHDSAVAAGPVQLMTEADIEPMIASIQRRLRGPSRF